MNNEEEISIVNIQLFALVVALFSAIISVIITYNQKLDLENKETLYNSDEILKITYFNRILILVLSLIFLYVNYKLYEISKRQGENLKSYNLQILASVLAVVSGAIALYVVTLSSTESVVDVENPII